MPTTDSADTLTPSVSDEESDEVRDVSDILLVKYFCYSSGSLLGNLYLNWPKLFKAFFRHFT